MNEDMYKYFCDNNLLTHGIGEIDEKETFYKFESIIKYGGLMSMQRLESEGIIVCGKASVGENDYRITQKNQISFFDPTLLEIKDRLLSKYYYFYLPFNPNVIFFIIDRENLSLQQNQTTPFELNENSGFVSVDNFKGIVAPKECVEYLSNILNKYSLNLPIYDFDFNIINNYKLDSNKKRK